MARPLILTSDIPNQRHIRRLFLFLTLIGAPLLTMAQSLTHVMQVELRPDSGVIVVEDAITVAEPLARFEFVLNTGLAVTSPDATLQRLTTSRDGLRAAYRATPGAPTTRLTLRYEGRPVFAKQRQMGGMPAGELGPDGIYLDSTSAWHARFDQAIDGLDMRVVVPAGWHSISIGRRDVTDGADHWTTAQPHDNLYLLAAPYQRYAQSHNGIDLSVWLRDDDPALAERYLGVMGGYIDHYAELIGPYPFAKFAVVENRWQTGYGMPSFTLLGSRVMRLPFIPFTSLPHEILHNWWGNGVWIDYAAGNWSEGLTAYLADHWMQERRGMGAQYRLKALQRYSNFAADGADAPLVDFVSRHNDASQSIGYSKSLMLFHMLRRELGDRAFTDGLRQLWREHRFEAVGFEDVVKVLTAGNPRLRDRATAWLEREGAARLTLEAVDVQPSPTGYRLDVTLRQAAPTFDVEIPISVMLEGEDKARLRRVRIAEEKTNLSLDFPTRPQRVDIDPAYDVLRFLDPSEQPPALNRLFGGKTWIVTPSSAGAAEQAAWQRLIAQWQRRYPQLRSIPDTEADKLPADSDRLILGWANRLRSTLADALLRDDQRLDAAGLVIGDTRYAAATHSMVVLNTASSGVTSGLIVSPTTDGVKALARKLPHYGSYGRLVFDAPAAQNLLKETLSSEHSRLTRQLDDSTVPLQLPAQPVLGQQAG